ncbi:MAG: beta-lactamase family protein [Xanthomonadales bacterium]|nr:beta-lactamase family protein [Xanthomonadales bacterium]
MKRLVLLAVALLAAGTDVDAAACTFADARSTFAAFLVEAGLPGGGFLVGTPQGVLAEHYFGGYDANTVVPVASASKLLSGVRILQVVERGEATLEAPVSTWLPQFTGEKGTMNLRQMFSHTAGYGGDSAAGVINDDSITLAQAVDLIACCRPLNPGYTVGGQFAYGGVSMHVAGRLAEVVGGGDWEQRWKSEIGAPLGITSIDWQGLGATLNYRIAGGAQSSLADYGRLLHMLANGGRGNNLRILRASTVEQLFVDNVGDLPIASAPDNAAPPIRYGIGAWLESDPGHDEATFLHSLGAFGFFPWIDRLRGLYGVFMIRGAPGINDSALPVYRQMLAAIDAETAAGACTPIAFEDEIFVGAFEN